MADITSGTVINTPLGDMHLGVIEFAAASAGDIVGVQGLVGLKIDGIVFAQSNSGTCVASSTSGSVTLGAAGATQLLYVGLSKKQ